MKDYFLVWRFFPKMSLGALFVAELMLLILGRQEIPKVVSSAFNAITQYFTETLLLISIIIIIGIISNIGIFALNFISLGIQSALLFLPQRIGLYLWTRSEFTSDLLVPVNEVALHLFARNQGYYLEFFKLRIYAAVNLDKKKQTQDFTASVESLVKITPSGWEAEAFNFLYLLSQDRRSIEILLDEVQLLWNILVVVLLSIPVVFLFDLSNWALFAVLPVLLIIILIDIQVIVRRKRFAAAVMLIAYMNNFSIGEQAEASDREGDALI